MSDDKRTISDNRAAVAHATRQLDLLSKALGRPDVLRVSTKASFDLAVGDPVEEQLRQIPIARLKDDTQGSLRFNALESAGYTNVSLIASASPSVLETIRGVGAETARQAVATARAVAEETRHATPFKFTSRRDHAHRRTCSKAVETRPGARGH
jgi:hypothetical protein